MGAAAAGLLVNLQKAIYATLGRFGGALAVYEPGMGEEMETQRTTETRVRGS